MTTVSTPDPQPLRCIRAHWSEGEVKDLLQKAPEELTQDELLKVVRDLDRRFMQLWDKVTFEGEHKLVDYDKLNKGP